VHHWSILIIVQRDATQSSLFIILQVHSTCFGCQPHPSSGVHKTVNTASGTGHIFCAATSFQHGQASLATLEGCNCTVPEAVVTVLCTPDDGCGWRPKQVEWTCRIINRLLCVASRWTVIIPLNAELNPICHLLALLDHHILHVSRIRINIVLYCFVYVWCGLGWSKSERWEIDFATEEGLSISLLGELSSSNAGRTVHGWRRDLWCSCVNSIPGEHWFFSILCTVSVW